MWLIMAALSEEAIGVYNLVLKLQVYRLNSSSLLGTLLYKPLQLISIF